MRTRPASSPYNPIVAEIRDWVELGKNTISSLKTSDVTRLYRHEWPETRRMLMAEHQEAIDGEHRRREANPSEVVEIDGVHAGTGTAQRVDDAWKPHIGDHVPVTDVEDTRAKLVTALDRKLTLLRKLDTAARAADPRVSQVIASLSSEEVVMLIATASG